MHVLCSLNEYFERGIVFVSFLVFAILQAAFVTVDLTGLQQKAWSVKVWHSFKFLTLVGLGGDEIEQPLAYVPNIVLRRNCTLHHWVGEIDFW